MPRGVYKRKKRHQKETVPAETVQLTAQTLAETPWVSKLSKVEISSVLTEGQGLNEATREEGEARMKVGQRLNALKFLLEPHNCFQKFLRRFTNYSVPTAYRYIRRYENATKSLPEAVVTAAMGRGIDITGATDAKPFGIYTRAIEKIGVPKKVRTKAQAEKFLDKVEEAKREVREEGPQLVTGDPELSKREVVRFFSLRYDKLPNNKRTRDKFAREVVALIMAKAKLDAQTITPIPVPEDYIVHRGRPRLVASA